MLLQYASHVGITLCVLRHKFCRRARKRCMSEQRRQRHEQFPTSSAECDTCAIHSRTYFLDLPTSMCLL